GAVQNAARTSCPPPEPAGPEARPSQASKRAGDAGRAATVSSSTPAARPRQPACAAPQQEPSAAQNNTGRQSAVNTTHTAPSSVATLASAAVADCDCAASMTLVPCT